MTRAQNGTTGATHANGASVSKAVTGVSGTAASPAPCVYTSGLVTLQPGTYYGGICIGSLSTTGCDDGQLFDRRDDRGVQPGGDPEHDGNR